MNGPAKVRELVAGALVIPPSTKEAKTPRSPHVWLRDVEFDPDADYFIKHLFTRGQLTVVYGPSGEGKTFWILDAVCHAAATLKYRNRRVRQCLVVYVACEAGSSITTRFYAWREHHRESLEGKSVPLAILTRGVNLLNRVEVDALMIDLRAIADEADMRIGMIVFDTLSRSMPGADENSAGDVTLAVGVADRLRDEIGAAVVFVHHTGKDSSKGPRGSSALAAAADTVICVTGRVATIEKSRDGPTGEEMPFGLKVVSLGKDEDGDEITTCVVGPAEAVPQQPKVKRTSNVEAIALNALHEAIGEHGDIMPGTSTIPPGVKAVTIDQWRARLKLRYGSDKDSRKRGEDAVRKAFQRAREALVASGAVTISDPYVWPVHRARSKAILSCEMM